MPRPYMAATLVRANAFVDDVASGLLEAAGYIFWDALLQSYLLGLELA